jgi:hypothetical protein
MRYLKHCARLLSWVGLAVLVFALAAVWAPAAPARADGDTVTLSVNYGPSGVYSPINLPIFSTVITLAQPFNSQENVTVSLAVDGASNVLSTTYAWGSGPTTGTITLKPSASTFTIGTHTVVATFTNPETNATATSNSLTFTMHQAEAEWDCYTAVVVQAGKPARIDMQVLGANLPIVWSQETATITLSGASSVTYTNLQPEINTSGDANTNGYVTITAPTKIGSYHLACSLSANAYFTFPTINPVASDFEVSDMLPTTVQIYTNPTTLTPNTPIEMYVVVKGAAGYPTPSGNVLITFNLGSTRMFTSQNQPLVSDGTLLITFQSNSSINNNYNIGILYSGDYYYASQNFTFTSTNRAIPSGSGSGQSGSSGSGGASGTATPGATGTAISQATPTGNAAATSGSSTSETPNTAANMFGPSASDWLIALSASAALLIILGGITIYVVFARRREANFKQETISGAPPTPQWSGLTNQTNSSDWRQTPTQPPYQG